MIEFAGFNFDMNTMFGIGLFVTNLIITVIFITIIITIEYHQEKKYNRESIYDIIITDDFSTSYTHSRESPKTKPPTKRASSLGYIGYNERPDKIDPPEKPTPLQPQQVIRHDLL